MARRKVLRGRGRARRHEAGFAALPVVLLGAAVAAGALLLGGKKTFPTSPYGAALDTLLAQTKPGQTGAALELDDALTAAKVPHTMQKYKDGGVMFFIASRDEEAASVVMAPIRARYQTSWLTS